MPTDPQILGFSNRWYAPAVRTAQTHPLDDIRVRVVTAPYLVATKLEAFADPERGGGDLWARPRHPGHHRSGDGRSELAADLRAAPEDVREYIALSLARALAGGELQAAVPAHLPPDDASQRRAGMIVERLQRIAALAR